MEQMEYHVVLTKGNREQRIMTFEDRSAATVYGKQFFDTLKPGDGVVTVEGIVKGDPRRRVFAGWHF